MELNLWDEEFRALAADVNTLAKDFSQDNTIKTRSIAKKHRIISQVESHLDKVNTRFKRLSQVTISTTNRLRALVYWAGELSTQGVSLTGYYETYLKQYMWIQLFKTRFLGDSPDNESYLISEAELEAMEEKQSSLKQMESYLHRQHFQLKKSEAELRRTYNELQTEEQNFLAGQSLQKQWGIGASKAQRNPVLGEISKLLFGIGFSSNTRIEEASQLKMLSRDLNSRSQRIMDECRSLMEHNDRLNKPQFDPTKVRTIKDSLKKIRHLENQVSQLARNALPQNQARSPILLKKSAIQVTTGAGNVS